MADGDTTKECPWCGCYAQAVSEGSFDDGAPVALSCGHNARRNPHVGRTATWRGWRGDEHIEIDITNRAWVPTGDMVLLQTNDGCPNCGGDLAVVSASSQPSGLIMHLACGHVVRRSNGEVEAIDG